MTKRALVLSGGSRFGAYQVGVIKALYANGNRYCIFSGTSVGGINGAYLAQYREDEAHRAAVGLEKFWHRIDTPNIWKHWFPMRELSALWKESAYNLEPLRRLIKDHFDVQRVLDSGNEWYAGLVSLLDGEYRVFSIHHPDPISVCIASSMQPFFMPPHLVDCEGTMHLCLDGGLRGATPLRAAIYAGADEIDVVLTEADRMSPYEGMFKNALDVGGRAVGIMSHNLFELDLELTLQENKLVRAGASDKRDIAIRVFRPSSPLVGNHMDFDPEGSKILIEHGFTEAMFDLRSECG